MTAPRIGLALGGGVARGWAHIGVLHRLNEIGLVPDLVCGTSMGALVGSFYLAGKLEEFEHLVRTLTRLKMVRLLDFMVPQNGILGGKRMFREMEKLVGEIHIEDLPKPFAAVAAELATGHEIWMTRGHMLDAVRASVSIPGVFKPVKRDGRWMIDGALVNPVPVSVCRAMGARMVIAVNLSGDTMGGIPAIDRRKGTVRATKRSTTATSGGTRWTPISALPCAGCSTPTSKSRIFSAPCPPASPSCSTASPAAGSPATRRTS